MTSAKNVISIQDAAAAITNCNSANRANSSPRCVSTLSAKDSSFRRNFKLFVYWLVFFAQSLIHLFSATTGNAKPTRIFSVANGILMVGVNRFAIACFAISGYKEKVANYLSGCSQIPGQLKLQILCHISATISSPSFIPNSHLSQASTPLRKNSRGTCLIQV